MKAKIMLFFSAIMLVACYESKPPAMANETIAETEDAIPTGKEAEESSPTPEYNPTDALTFGLKGHVQQATTQSFLTYEEGGELKRGGLNTIAKMAFDPWGHVTRDEWENEYGYDAEGNYYRGNHTYTIIKRGKSGQLIKYIDEEPKTDNESNCTFTFVYDKNGRLNTVTQCGWTSNWSETYYYESGNIYPSNITKSADYEGGGASKSSINYQYSHFDEKGNWTERLCICSEEETIDDSESLDGQRTQINETIFIEERTITYYD